MSLHAQYRKDATTQWVTPTAGVQINTSHFDPRQPDYVNNFQRVTKPVRKLVEQNLLSPEKDREYAIKAFCATCVKGWRTVDETGVVIRDGEINVKDDEWVSFTQDNAIAVFMAYPQFYNDLVDLARDLKTFQLSDDERGNSKPV